MQDLMEERRARQHSGLAAGRGPRPGQRAPRARLGLEADAGAASDAYSDDDAGYASAGAGAGGDGAARGAARGDTAARQRTQRRMDAWRAREEGDAAHLRLSSRAHAKSVEERRLAAAERLTGTVLKRMDDTHVCPCCSDQKWDLAPHSDGVATVLVVTAAVAFRWPVPGFTCASCGHAAPTAEPDLVPVGYWPSTPSQPEAWFEQPLMHSMFIQELNGSSLEQIGQNVQALLGHPMLLGVQNLLPSKE